MITASIVLYNTPEMLVRELVCCIEKSRIDKVYFIDNSPVAYWEELLGGISPKAIYLWGQGNVGYGRAHNIALRMAIDAGADYHVVINPDITFESEVIEQLFCFMESHEDVGCVMPDVVYPDGREQFLCKLLPTPLDMFGRRLLPRKWMHKRNYRFEMRETGYQQVRNVPLLSGCFMFMRMGVIKEVGLFDDRFFMYFEDYDLIRRIHRISKTVFYPKARIVHNHAHEHRSSKRLLWVSMMSACRYFNKWGWLFDKERNLVNRNAFSVEHVIED